VNLVLLLLMLPLLLMLIGSLACDQARLCHPPGQSQPSTPNPLDEVQSTAEAEPPSLDHHGNPQVDQTAVVSREHTRVRSSLKVILWVNLLAFKTPAAKTVITAALW